MRAYPPPSLARHAARRPALADVASPPCCSGSWSPLSSPHGYLDPGEWQLWLALIYIGVIAGPTGTWTTVSVTRALPPVTTSLGMLGVPLVGIASSVVLLGEPITAPLAIGTALIIGRHGDRHSGECRASAAKVAP